MIRRREFITHCSAEALIGNKSAALRRGHRASRVGQHYLAADAISEVQCVLGPEAFFLAFDDHSAGTLPLKA
jgi:hypothetical protein